MSGPRAGFVFRRTQQIFASLDAQERRRLRAWRECPPGQTLPPAGDIILVDGCGRGGALWSRPAVLDDDGRIVDLLSGQEVEWPPIAN